MTARQITLETMTPEHLEGAARHGTLLLDGFAGLWCVNVGYGHESIVEVAAEQMRRLPYATLSRV